jgi:hypothetical protein
MARPSMPGRTEKKDLFSLSVLPVYRATFNVLSKTTRTLFQAYGTFAATF